MRDRRSTRPAMGFAAVVLGFLLCGGVSAETTLIDDLRVAMTGMQGQIAASMHKMKKGMAGIGQDAGEPMTPGQSCCASHIEIIRRHLDEGSIVLVSPLGYSATGEVFNLLAEDVATAIATELRAAKLVFLREAGGLYGDGGGLLPELTLEEATPSDARHDPNMVILRECANDRHS